MNNYTLFISLPIECNASDTNDTYGMASSNVDKSSNHFGSDCTNEKYQLG
jgi:hypothetical protein